MTRKPSDKQKLEVHIFLFFSDGGYRSSIPCSVGAFLVLAVYTDQTCFLAGQGFILNGYSGPFPAEAVALETAVSFLVDWLHPTGM